MIQLKRLTAADLDEVQAICESRIKTEIENYRTGFGRMDELYHISQIMEMLMKCQGCDVETAPARPRKVA